MKHKKKIIFVSISILLVFALTLSSPFWVFVFEYRKKVDLPFSYHMLNTSRITKADKKIANLASKKEVDRSILSDIYKTNCLYYNLTEFDTAIYLDFVIDEKVREIIKTEENASSITITKFTFSNDKLIINTDNKNLTVLEKSNLLEEDISSKIPFLNPFNNNPSSLQEKEYAESSHRIVDTISSFPENTKRTARIYETQNNFKPLDVRGVVFEKNADIAEMAMLMKISLPSLIDWLNRGNFPTILGLIDKDILFCTFISMSFFHKREAVIEKPSTNSDEEAVFYHESGYGLVEMKYECPFFINENKDIVSLTITEKPESMKLCDDYYYQKAVENYAKESIKSNIKYRSSK
ncbi:MAG: hypothetical protein LBJ12_06360 [Oscillospiraceae bacterium]|jgi:hypothetical protein|nr:hypothetical protein [Oscillospiraceae bacterium]